MQALTKYFGLEAEVKSILDPAHVNYVAERIRSSSAANFHDLNRISIYLHTLTLKQCERKKFFGKVVPLQNRLSSIEVEFRVNPKQQHNGAIKFYNFAFDDKVHSGTVAGVSPFLIRRTITSYKIHHGQAYQTELITCIGSSLREKYRKIKLLIHANVTHDYKQLLKHQDAIETHLDVPLEFSIELRAADKTHDGQLPLYLLTPFNPSGTIETPNPEPTLHEIKPISMQINITSSQGVVINTGSTGNISQSASGESKNQTLEEALAFLQARYQLSTIDPLDKADAIHAITSLRSIEPKKSEDGMLSRAEEKIGLLRRIAESSAGLAAICHPYIDGLVRYFTK